MEATEHISLYRKWRPRTFSEVVGQPHVTGTLANAISSGRVVHAYLFCGPLGTGKTSTARILAKAINCVEGPTAVPCNTCDACISITQGTALDVIEIDAASNRKIDEIRELLEKIPYTPTALRTKVYIVDEVHQLTTEASSALLKTLEEPPGHVVFVLATTESHKILPTIVSRCQRFDFTLVPTQEIAGLLGRIASHEGIKIDSGAIGMIAEHAHGSVRDAIGVMDQISNLSDETVTQRQAADLLGEVESVLVFDMIDIIVEGDTPGALALIGRIVDSGKDPRRFVESLISHLRSIFLIQNAAQPRQIVEATDEHFAELEQRSQRLRRYEVMRLIERFGGTHREMRWSESARMVLECALVRITSLETDLTVEGIAFRLEELERKLEALAGGEPTPATPAPGTGKAVGRALPRGGKGSAAAAESPAAGKGEPVAGGAAGSSGGSAQAREGAASRPAPDATAANAPGLAGARESAESRGPAAKSKAKSKAKDGSDDAFSSREEKDKMRRAWLAVLGELKNQGQMRLYALLSRARITGARQGEVTLGFPGDASFQLEILSEPGQLEKVEGVLAHCVGAPVKLTLTTLEGRARGGPKRTPGSSGDPAGKNEPGEKTPQAGDQAMEAREASPEKENARELAERIKESFDGEILE